MFTATISSNLFSNSFTSESSFYFTRKTRFLNICFCISSVLCMFSTLTYMFNGGQGEDTEESVSLNKPRTKTSTTAPEEASLTQKTPAKKKPTVQNNKFLIISVFFQIFIQRIFRSKRKTCVLQEGSEAAQLKVKKPAVVKKDDDDEVDNNNIKLKRFTQTYIITEIIKKKQ